MKMISEVVSLVLASIVELYFLYTSWQVWGAILDFQNNKDRHVYIFGKIETLVEIETIKRGKSEIRTAYPVYVCYLEGGARRTTGLIRYPMEQLCKQMNDDRPLIYDRKTGRVWNELEIPIMKRKLTQKVVCVTLLLMVVVIAATLI